MHRPLHPRCPVPDGFTLIELLLVTAVLALLAGLSCGLVAGVNGAADRARARAELALLAQALETYKLRCGDYPLATQDPSSLANTSGLRSALARGGGIEGALAAVEYGVDGAPIRWLDPWGRPYAYAYGSGAGRWVGCGYLLFSHGPDGVTTLPAEVREAGVLPEGFLELAGNRDTIFAGR